MTDTSTRVPFTHAFPWQIAGSTDMCSRQFILPGILVSLYGSDGWAAGGVPPGNKRPAPWDVCTEHLIADLTRGKAVARRSVFIALLCADKLLPTFRNVGRFSHPSPRNSQNRISRQLMQRHQTARRVPLERTWRLVNRSESEPDDATYDTRAEDSARDHGARPQGVDGASALVCRVRQRSMGRADRG